MNTEQTLRKLTIENHELRTENAELRHKLREAGYHVKRIEQAYKDALQLALWKAAGIHPSRRFAAQHGMTQQRWDNPTALLRMARVIQDNRRWVTKYAALIELRLSRVRLEANEERAANKARHIRDRQARKRAG
jgi:hypothetical protein